MQSNKPYRAHLNSSNDLVTTHEEIRAGFVALALERNREATPFIAEARALKALASRVSTPAQLLTIQEIRLPLLTAARVSDKAKSHMEQTNQDEAINGLIRNFLEPAGSDFIEELVYRFLLTRGDALGGSMRNIGGELAKRKFAGSILAALSIVGISYKWLHSNDNVWLSETRPQTDIEQDFKGLNWVTAMGHHRTMIFNLNVPLVANNEDVCLFKCSSEEYNTNTRRNPSLFMALGEIKGGIDPAGADEHWKTARTALTRVRSSFSGHDLSPKTFFIGAAIAERMANEIWEQLEAGTLNNAANLTDGVQVASLCNWLITL